MTRLSDDYPMARESRACDPARRESPLRVGRVDAEVAQAQGAYAQALTEYRSSMLRGSEEVENTIVALTQLERQRLDLNDGIIAGADRSHVISIPYGEWLERCGNFAAQ
jgi:hypothetical protein